MGWGLGPTPLRHERLYSRLEVATSAQTMVAEQLIPHGVTDERVLAVMSEVPREEFLTGRARRHAYEDRALAIGWGQTISQPLVVAMMTQSLNLNPESIALEVGTGAGYQAAILSRLCRRVITIEREPALAEQASATLKRMGLDNVEVAVADGSIGWPSEAPYDGILVACAAPEGAPALIRHVAGGGRVLLPGAVVPQEAQGRRRS